MSTTTQDRHAGGRRGILHALMAVCLGSAVSLALGSEGIAQAAPAYLASRLVAVLPDRAFFIEWDQERQRWGLWTTDGTPAGTHLARMLPRDREPEVRWIGAAGAQALLGIDDGRHGMELWASDGTRTGTRLVTDLRPGPEGSGPEGLAQMNGEMVFRANDGMHGAELWSTDGTARGTRRISDIRPGRNTGWRTWPSNPVELTGRALFLVDDGIHGEEPWVTDGTVAGTHLLVDLQPGSPGSEVEMLGAGSSAGPAEGDPVRRALFLAANATGARRLWSSDGTAAGTGSLTLPGPVADLESIVRCGSDQTGPGITILAVIDPATVGIWRTDGTPDGTAFLTSIPARIGDDRASVTCHNDTTGQTLLRRFEDADGPTVLLSLEDGRVQRLTGVDPGPSAATLSGVTYLAAADGVHGPALWRTDGTEAGTRMIRDIAPDDEPPFEDAIFGYDGIVPLGEGVLFAADDGTHGYELWTSDGTETGTRLLADLAPGPASPFLMADDDGSTIVDASLERVGDRILFRADDGVHESEMWTTDGTPSGTRPLRRADRP